MEQRFEDIGRSGRYFESQYETKNIGGKIENSSDDSTGITNPETVSKNR